jgi:hypothetical protein
MRKSLKESVMAMKHHPLAIRRLVGISLLGVIIAVAGAHGSLDAARAGVFTANCARLDLRAFSAIEERGETGAVPTAWLANAGQAYLRARMLCLSGEESKGTEFYQRIIDGDASLSDPWMTE